MTNTCVWIKRPASLGVAAIYCGVKTKRHWKIDIEAGTRVVSWAPFCPYHTILAAKQDKEDSDN